MRNFSLSCLLCFIFLLSHLSHNSAHAQGPPRRPEVLKIGLVAPLSGNEQWMGERILKGVQHALSSKQDELNINIRLSLEDTQGDPARASSAVKNLGEDRDVLAIIGPAFSEEAIEAAPSATLMRIPVISPTAVNPDIANLSPYLFRNAVTQESEVNQIVDYAIQKLGIFSFSILYPLNTRGTKIQEEFTKRVEKLGGRIVYSFSYHPKETDFADVLKRMGGLTDEELSTTRGKTVYPYNQAVPLEYQAIFIPGNTSSASLIAAALHYYNMTRLRVLGDSQWNSKDVPSLGTPYMEGAVFIDGFFAGSPWPQVAKFVESFRRAFNQEPDIISAQAYDAASILLDIIKTGAREREAIREALLQLKEYPGVSGYTTFLPSGDSQKELFILTIEKGRTAQIN